MQSVIEVLKTALFNEVRASVFYTRAAELTTHDDTRMLFLELLGMEDDHARALVQKMAAEPALAGFDASGYWRDVEAQAASAVTAAELEKIRSSSIREVLIMAAQMEEKAANTYLALAEAVTNAEGKRHCMDLHREELSHRDALEKALRGLDMDDEDRTAL